MLLRNGKIRNTRSNFFEPVDIWKLFNATPRTVGSDVAMESTRENTEMERAPIAEDYKCPIGEGTIDLRLGGVPDLKWSAESKQ